MERVMKFIAEKSLEYRLAEYDEGGFLGIDTKLLASSLEAYAEQENKELQEKCDKMSYANTANKKALKRVADENEALQKQLADAEYFAKKHLHDLRLSQKQVEELKKSTKLLHNLMADAEQRGVDKATKELQKQLAEQQKLIEKHIHPRHWQKSR